MLQTIVHAWAFSPEEYADHQYSDVEHVHLRLGKGGLELRPNDRGEYPTEADCGPLYVVAPVFSPGGAQAWQGIQAFTEEPAIFDPEVGEITTTVWYRLHAGAAHQYWTGSEWREAASDEWNTLAQLQEGLPFWPVGDAPKIGLVYRLSSDGQTITPRVLRVLLAYSVDVPSWMEEYVLRTLVRELKAAAVQDADVVVEWEGGLEQDVAPTEWEEPLEVLTAEAAYYLPSDPGKLRNLLQSYTDGVVRLADDTPAGQLLLRVRHAPLVVLRTHPDFVEVSRLPAIVLEDVREVLVGDDGSVEGVVRVTSPWDAVVVPAPRQVDYEISLRLVAARSLDLLRLLDSVQAFVSDHSVLVSPATGEPVGLTLLREASMGGSTDGAHVQEATLPVLLQGCNKWLRGAREGHGVGVLDLELRSK